MGASEIFQLVKMPTACPEFSTQDPYVEGEN